MHMGRRLTVLWDERELGNSVMLFYLLLFSLLSFPMCPTDSMPKWGHLVRYCNTKTSHNGVNSMWTVKNSTNLLSSLDQLDVLTATSVQTYDFSTLYTSIPHNLLKSLITTLVHNSFKRKDGSNRYIQENRKVIDIGRQSSAGFLGHC